MAELGRGLNSRKANSDAPAPQQSSTWQSFLAYPLLHVDIDLVIGPPPRVTPLS